jgi:carboxyl-terminal processing protease
MRPLATLLLAAPIALLVACGGGEEAPGQVAPPASCSAGDQKAWLAGYMDDWYFWYRLAPRPQASAFPTVAEYFDALLYTGTSADFPRDRWSRFESTESYNRFFGDGQTLGYGVAVAGLEVLGRPDEPLFVRHVEARSPAAAAGVLRGDEVLAVNGRSSVEIIAANDFSALTPTATGQVLTLQLRRARAVRNVSLTSAVFALTPVPTDTVITSSGGRRLGYIHVKDMISQANAPIEAAFARFRSVGLSAVVLDLRYNGGGLVSVGNTVAGHAAGDAGSGRTYTTLLYNDKRAGANNTTYNFFRPLVGSTVNVSRVYVLMGERTCSASEQLINGLLGIGVEVVAIGDASCGKPVGFLPTAQCGTTYSVVNFESVNARNEGRYFDGLAPSCSVSEDFSLPLGDRSEPLLAAALVHVDTGACPRAAPVPSGTARALSAQRRARGFVDDSGQGGSAGRGMVDR